MKEEYEYLLQKINELEKFDEKEITEHLLLLGYKNIICQDARDKGICYIDFLFEKDFQFMLIFTEKELVLLKNKFQTSKLMGISVEPVKYEEICKICYPLEWLEVHKDKN